MSAAAPGPFDFGLGELKAGFFDTEAVRRQLDRAARAALSKFGAFVRTRARTSVRKRKAVSAPGGPPSSHEGSLRKLILFAFDPARKSVVIGPARFKRGEAPPLLEYGGTVVRQTRDGPRRMVYRPRPFIGPAAAAELPRLGSLIRSAVR